ncbi:conserved Plasmodium protein, unknown function [Plasmodium sp. gorilla clade G3]|nr:conserved Plasmodium protein, unknown function [Plasmodium sp. gorilla clade G3]
MFLYFLFFLFTVTYINNTLNIKKKAPLFKFPYFIDTYITYNNSNKRRRIRTLLYFARKETNRHVIYRKRFERDLKYALQSIFYKQGIKLNYKYHIDEDIIDGISVYKVELNSDCSVAKVFVEIMGDSIDARQGYIWIKRNTKDIRYKLAQLIKERKRVPFLNFVLCNLSEQTQLLCEMENIKEYYSDLFKDELTNDTEE